jgi:tetratricopeptide (TPR) repeat protein
MAETDIEAFWEYGDPAGSEARFRAALVSAAGDERLELLTQIARTYSLRKRFDEAHALLDEVERELPGAASESPKGGVRPHVRYRLERGRTFNSSGATEQARALFVSAWEEAEAAGLEGLAVDAAHMVAITHAGTPDGVAWGRRGLELARASEDPKARALIPALLNNLAWDLHDMGRFSEALPWFEEAQAEWTARGKPKQIQAARWAVARCLRSLGRTAEALAILHALEAEHAAAGTSDPSIAEELAAIAGPHWDAWQFVLGEWVAEGGGEPGQGTGVFSFLPDLQQRVLVRRNHVDYPETPSQPAFAHDDLLVVYLEDMQPVRAIYFDNEGHVIRYTAEANDGRAVFLSDALPAAPRFRLSYSKTAESALTIRFEIAPPGQPDAFSVYTEGVARRK